MIATGENGSQYKTGLNSKYSMSKWEFTVKEQGVVVSGYKMMKRVRVVLY